VRDRVGYARIDNGKKIMELINNDIQQLDLKVSELIEVCSQLKLENSSLLDQQQTLIEERAKQSMIMRLKSLEAAT